MGLFVQPAKPSDLGRRVGDEVSVSRKQGGNGKNAALIVVGPKGKLSPTVDMYC